MIKTLALAVMSTALMSFNAHASLDVVGATISDLQINRALGNYVFVKVLGGTFSISGGQACGNQFGSWQYTLPMNTAQDRDLYAMLLSAYASGATINIGGAGVCGWGSFEAVNGVQLTH